MSTHQHVSLAAAVLVPGTWTDTFFPGIFATAFTSHTGRFAAQPTQSAAEGLLLPQMTGNGAARLMDGTMRVARTQRTKRNRGLRIDRIERMRLTPWAFRGTMAGRLRPFGSYTPDRSIL